MTLLVTGDTGMLGVVFKKTSPGTIYMGSSDCNIPSREDYEKVRENPKMKIRGDFL